MVADAITYSDSGVDIRAGDEAVERIRGLAHSTFRPEVLGGLGGFGGFFRIPIQPGSFAGPVSSASSAAATGYRQPILVASTDGVGTKVLVAEAARSFSGIGVDLVAMCVDDIVCHGAEPLFFLDYLAMGKLDIPQVEEVVTGIVEGCRTAGCALIGGETAEHPGAMGASNLDLAGFAVGVVEEPAILGSSKVQSGDVLIGLASPGLRCNGYSLARKALAGPEGLALDEPAWPGCNHSIADELLRPSVIYAPVVLQMARAAELHAAAHITGGGIAGNLSRSIPDDCGALIDRTSWHLPRIFAEIMRRGPVAKDEMERVFNLGLGMIIIVSPRSAEDALAAARDSGYEARVVGSVVPGEHKIVISGGWWEDVDEHLDDRYTARPQGRANTSVTGLGPPRGRDR